MSSLAVLVSLLVPIFVYIGASRFHGLTRQRDTLLKLRRELALLTQYNSIRLRKLNQKPN